MKKLVLVLAVLALMSVGVTAQAAQFMNITFDNDAIGSAPTTGGGGSTVQAIGGYNNSSLPAWDPGYVSPPTSNEGTILVGNSGGMNKAAIMTTNPGNPVLGALWMDTSFSQTSSYINLSFDLSVLTAPTSATVQPKYLNNSPDQAGILFGINTFISGGRAFLFAVAPTSDIGGVFALRDTTNNKLMTFGNYVEGQKYNIALSADYSLGTVDAYINGVLAMSGHPLWTGALSTAPTTTEIFMYLNGENGYANAVAIDNIKGYNAPVPIPGALWLLGPGLMGLVGVRRRFRK